MGSSQNPADTDQTPSTGAQPEGPLPQLQRHDPWRGLRHHDPVRNRHRRTGGERDSDRHRRTREQVPAVHLSLTPLSDAAANERTEVTQSVAYVYESLDPWTAPRR